MTPFRRIIVASLWVCLCTSVTACAQSGMALEGKVLEHGTEEPIDGAMVIVHWTGFVSTLADSQGVCVFVDTTTTDRRGSFRFPGWIKRSEVGPVYNLGPVVGAYKSGYVQPIFASDRIVRLERFSDGTQERQRYLQQIAQNARCPSAGESKRNLLPYFRAIYDEAKELAATSADHEVTDQVLFYIESIELGYDAASKLAIGRAEKRGR